MDSLPDHAAVVGMLAAYRDREPGDIAEEIDSLELAWLISQVEQRYGVLLDLEDDDLIRMNTVSSAVETLRRTMSGAGS